MTKKFRKRRTTVFDSEQVYSTALKAKKKFHAYNNVQSLDQKYHDQHTKNT